MDASAKSMQASRIRPSLLTNRRGDCNVDRRRVISARIYARRSCACPSHRVAMRTEWRLLMCRDCEPQYTGKLLIMAKVRVAIIGVGNCASSLVQGVQFYRDARAGDFVPGLMHVDLGGYQPRDIEFSAAFDVNADKVGRDLAEAVFAEPNNTARFADVPPLGVKVRRGMTHDGLGKYLKNIVPKARGSTDDIVGILKKTRTDVVVSYLPVGSEMATKWYVEQVLDAGCAFVNCIPVFIAREPYWQRRFEEKGLPVVG
ncbi:MAG TPA: hypothetical protein VED01_11000, partial [Burkholderiales bacterium]|nr:hypothetical protein [Burkholderiales bacterium]